jgi:glutathione synthase
MGRLLWVTNCWNDLKPHETDTSLRLMQAAVTLGCETLWCSHYDIEVQNNRVTFSAKRLIKVGSERHASDFCFESPRPLTLYEGDLILLRVDPPVDSRYLQALQHLQALVTLQPEDAPHIVNSPGAVLGLASKTISLLAGFPVPRSMITARKTEVSDFVHAVGSCVMKPVADMQGHGIRLLNRFNCEKELQSVPGPYLPAQMVVQQHLSADAGETRLWFVAGELVGAALRRRGPTSGPLDLVTPPVHTTPYVLTERQRCQADHIGQVLSRAGIVIAAVDWIDGMVIDVNIVSPGLIVEMEQYDAGLSERILTRLLHHANGSLRVYGRTR